MTEQEGFIEAIAGRDRALKELTDEIEIMRYEVEAVLAIKAERDALKDEIAGWKADQQENMKNQCELVGQLQQALVERDSLRDAARLALDALNYVGYVPRSDGSHPVEKAAAALKAVL